MRSRLLLVLSLVAGSWVATSQPAQAEVTCPPDIVNTTVYGNVNVPAAGVCSITGSTITGNVIVAPGGSVTIKQSFIGGNVTAGSGSNAELGSSSIGGNVIGQGADLLLGAVDVKGGVRSDRPVLVAGTERFTICASTIQGSVTVSNAPSGPGTINIGAPGPNCPNALTRAGGAIGLTANQTASVIGNTVAPVLYCSANNPPPTNAGGNSFSSTSGQCAGF